MEKERLSYRQMIPTQVKHLFALGQSVKSGGLEENLLHLVDIRASQLNHCAFCLDMHVKEARRDGLGELKLYSVSVWQESPLFTDRERTALAWTEAVTLVSESHVPDDAFQKARAVFSETELALLTMAIVTINSWNRLAVSFRMTPGSLDQEMGLDKVVLSA